MSIPMSGVGLHIAHPPAPRHKTVPVSEVFGPVWQGEGPHTGRVCHFLRLGMCNLHCSWCDTPYTWDTTRFDVDAECPPQTGEWIADQLDGVDLVILSGGEPMIHQHNEQLHRGVRDVGELHVETNGTITPNYWALESVDHFTVSPKVLFQGDPAKRRLRMDTLAAFTKLAEDYRAVFKVVVKDATEVYQVAAFFDALEVPAHARWVMPEGTSQTAVLHHAGKCVEAARECGLNLTLRQHTLLFGSERGQ